MTQKRRLNVKAITILLLIWPFWQTTDPRMFLSGASAAESPTFTRRGGLPIGRQALPTGRQVSFYVSSSGKNEWSGVGGQGSGVGGRVTGPLATLRAARETMDERRETMDERRETMDERRETKYDGGCRGSDSMD